MQWRVKFIQTVCVKVGIIIIDTLQKPTIHIRDIKKISKFQKKEEN